jgi:predicted transcriptional regulator
METKFSTTAKVRYEIEKLIERDIIEKKQNSNYYKVTSFGAKWLWVTNCTNEHFTNPLLSIISKNDMRNFNLQPSKIEESYIGINANLNNLLSELYMKK